MLRIKINNSSYEIKTLFSELKLSELRVFYEWFSKLSPKYQKFIESKEALFLEEEIELQLKQTFISFFCDIDKEEIKKLTELDIEFLFSNINIFADFPEEGYKIDKYPFNGVEYHYITPKEIDSPIKIKGFTYKQYKLAASMANNIRNLKTPKTIDSLVNLCAVLLTDGDNEETAIDKRVELFKELEADIAYSVYYNFCLAFEQSTKFFPLIFEGGGGSAPAEKGANVKITAQKDVVIKNYYWDIIGSKVAEKGILNTNSYLGVNAVDNSPAMEVLKQYQIILATE